MRIPASAMPNRTSVAQSAAAKVSLPLCTPPQIAVFASDTRTAAPCEVATAESWAARDRAAGRCAH